VWPTRKRKGPAGRTIRGEQGERGLGDSREGDAEHGSNAEEAEEEPPKGTKKVGHRNLRPSTTSRRNPSGPSLLSIIGRTRSAQSAQNTFTDT
jgi:hypothetical protein